MIGSTSKYMKLAAILPCTLLATFSTIVAVSAQTLPLNYQLQLQVRAANGGTATLPSSPVTRQPSSSPRAATA